MTDKQALKPCPFCGGTDLSVLTHDVQPDNYHGGYVTCTECDAQGADAITLNGWLHSPEEANDAAVAAWNTRANRANRPADDGLVEMASALRNTLVGHPFTDGTRQTLADALCDGLNCNPNDDSAADTYDALHVIAATALRAQSDAEVERLRAGLRFAMGFVPPPGKDATDGYRSRYEMARQALERGEHRKDGV